MANVIPLSAANDLAALFQQAQQSAYAWNSARSIALKMIGLDPAKQYSIDFATGLVGEPPGPARPPVPPDVTSDPEPVESPAEEPTA